MPRKVTRPVIGMGFFDWFWNLLEWLGLKNKSGKLLLLGLDSAGKTTLLNMLKNGNFVQFDQTRSYHIEELVIEGIKFSAYDLGGHKTARESWSEYFVSCNAVIFMIDSADTGRFAEAKAELDAILNNPELRNVPILILGNKIDLPGAVSAEQLASEFGIYNQTPADVKTVPPGQRPIRIFMCSVKRKMGYSDGIRWLANFI